MKLSNMKSSKMLVKAIAVLLLLLLLWPEQNQRGLLFCEAFLGVTIMIPRRLPPSRPALDFLIPCCRSSGGTFTLSRITALDMGKGFSSAKNKQAALARKLQQAKQQQQTDKEEEEEQKQTDVPPNEKTKNKPRDDKDDDMRAEFRKLLASNLPPPEPTSSTPASSLIRPPPKQPQQRAAAPTITGPKVKARDLKRKRKRQEAAASLQGQEAPSSSSSDKNEKQPALLGVGDQARRRDFETLLDPATLQPLGALVAAQLVPWVPPYLTDYLVIVADPRRQSQDWRAVWQTLVGNDRLWAEHSVKLLAVTADEPQAVTAWRKRAGLHDNDNNDNVYTLVDSSSLDWMHTYCCVNNDASWSTHVLMIDNDGIIRQHYDHVKPALIAGMVTQALREMEK